MQHAGWAVALGDIPYFGGRRYRACHDRWTSRGAQTDKEML